MQQIKVESNEGQLNQIKKDTSLVQIISENLHPW